MSEAESETPEYDPNPNDNYLPCEWLPREEIKPNDWNPNEMDEEHRERLRLSLLDNGWTMPIVVHAEEYYIVDGEQRWTVAGHEDVAECEELTPEGIPAGHVPVYGITIEEEQAKMATIQHNRARGDVDLESMREYLEQLDQRTEIAEVSDRIGYDEDDAERILGEVTAREIGEDEEFSHPWEPVERHEMSAEEMEEERSASLRRAIERAGDDDEAESIARESERINLVITDEELSLVEEVLGEEDQAQTFVNLVDFVAFRGYISQFREDLEAGSPELDALYETYESTYEERY